MITKFLPGHDARLVSSDDKETTIDIEFQFSDEMDCGEVTSSIDISSTTADKITAKIDNSTVSCNKITGASPSFSGEVTATWSWKATLLEVSDGIHAITVKNATTSDGDRKTGSVDRFLIRVGKETNPMVFPRLANYTRGVLFKDGASGDLFVSHKAAGADKWRYSLNWASSWSDWLDYGEGGNSTLKEQKWSGTKKQSWSGEHVILQYWSRLSGSSSTLQHADLDPKQTPRRYPHLFAQGPFNLFGFDGGLNNAFTLNKDGNWNFHFMTEWPSKLQVNVWGQNPDGQADQGMVFGDLDENGILDRALPDALGEIIVNFTDFPPSPHLAYRWEVSDNTFAFRRVPVGSRFQQIIMFALLWTIPIATGVLSVWTYMGVFYSVKFNKIGISTKIKLPFAFRRKFQKLNENDDDDFSRRSSLPPSIQLQDRLSSHSGLVPSIAVTEGKRRTILVATMEYDIEDWAIKIKIGGLGVMAQ
jgi:alpha-1,3-glucan synthase